MYINVITAEPILMNFIPELPSNVMLLEIKNVPLGSNLIQEEQIFVGMLVILIH